MARIRRTAVVLAVFVVIGVAPLFSGATPPPSTDKPSLQVTANDGADAASAGIAIVASDEEGLDSLTITCRAADERYHTQLSRSAADRRFTRLFTLSQMFPSVAEWKSPVALEITLRNTRGATTSASVLVRLKTKRRD